jgi:rhodanese-related sulfurtransferase
LLKAPNVQFVIENWLLILAALVSGGLLLWPSLRGGGSGITPAEAVRLMNHAKAVVIDVCEPAEFAAGHIGGARSVPLGGLAEAKGLPSNKSLPLVVVCAAGVRAQRAAGVLQKLGYEDVKVLAGGMRAWREASLPVETGAKG